jgi:hypothetical protein
VENDARVLELKLEVTARLEYAVPIPKVPVVEVRYLNLAIYR